MEHCHNHDLLLKQDNKIDHYNILYHLSNIFRQLNDEIISLNYFVNPIDKSTFPLQNNNFLFHLYLNYN